MTFRRALTRLAAALAAACAIAAIPPMNVPQMPRICRCMSKRLKMLFGKGANIRGFECVRVHGGIGQRGTR